MAVAADQTCARCGKTWGAAVRECTCGQELVRDEESQEEMFARLRHEAARAEPRGPRDDRFGLLIALTPLLRSAALTLPILVSGARGYLTGLIAFLVVHVISIGWIFKDGARWGTDAVTSALLHTVFPIVGPPFHLFRRASNGAPSRTAAWLLSEIAGWALIFGTGAADALRSAL
jgi:hypothetical protein